MPKVPKTMSTQHPDNVNPPFFASDPVLGGDDEVVEAYYAFSHLGCEEQMWDYEGKEVDSFVVRKLLTRFPKFFEQNPLGKERFLTLRLPNPSVEKAEAKVLLETLESIPRSFDAARLVQGNVPPVFEVILPMTTSAEELNRVYYYYKNFVIGKQSMKAFEADKLTIAEWIGSLSPETINVIPLFEEKHYIPRAAEIVAEYLHEKDLEHQRVFLGRSDPAMNYGSLAATLMIKVALLKLWELEGETGVRIYPILGVGSPPFRGGLKPSSVERVLDEFSAWTFTVQSSFKYDSPADEVRRAVEAINQHRPTRPQHIEVERCLELIEKLSEAYQSQVELLVELITRISPHIPPRRRRKLHIGLFGYARRLRGIALPRAIPFTASLYSIGLPPELLGLDALAEKDLEFVCEVYRSFEQDLLDALRYFNPKSLEVVPKGVARRVERTLLRFEGFERDQEHERLTEQIISSLGREEELRELILRAAWVRGFLG